MLKNPTLVAPLTALIMLVAARHALAGERPGFKVKAGLLEGATASEARLRETAEVTMDPARRPGWCFLVDPPNSRHYEVYSVHHLPGAPKSLARDFEGIAPDRAVDGIKTNVEQVDGSRTFCFDFNPGDPLGEYRVEVFINGTLQTTIRLNVVAAAGRDQDE